MTKRIAFSAVALALLCLSSCKNGQPDAKTEPQKSSQSKKYHEEDPNRRALSETAAKVALNERKDTYVVIEFWENGKPSERFDKVERRFVSPDGQLAVALQDRPGDGKTMYDIVITDGLGPSPIATLDLPAGLKHHVSPLPAEVTLKNGAAANLCYVCVGKECEIRPNESAEDLARRVEYAAVLSLKEVNKE
jgi:hypothetical protein